MQLRGGDGQSYWLERELKRGGEGAIWSVRNRLDVVAKIYHRPVTRPEAKLVWMVEHPPDDPTAVSLDHTSIAWPHILLYEGDEFVGFLMPFIDGAVPLLRVFNPRSRRQTLPGFDWRYLHRTAANLASSLAAVHAKGYVVGDINEGNFVVKPSTLITVLDCDSFQVVTETAHGRQVYRCAVGKPEYTAPELQGKNYASVDRTTDHDSFGLGVIVFQLLLNGNHPFRSDWRGQGEPPDVSSKIEQGLFPHSRSAASIVAPPTGALPLDSLHPTLQEVMIRCFVDGHSPPHRRPSAEEWEQGIKAAERALTRCTHGHVFSGHAPRCPWCEIETRRMRAARAPKPMSPPISAGRGSRFPGPAPAPPPTALPYPQPTSARGVAAGLGALVRLFLYIVAGIALFAGVLNGLVDLGGSSDDSNIPDDEATSRALMRESHVDPTAAEGTWIALNTKVAADRGSLLTATPRLATSHAQVTQVAKLSGEIDACSLVNREDAEEIMGVELSGDPFPGVPGFTDSKSFCTYDPVSISGSTIEAIESVQLTALKEEDLKALGMGEDLDTLWEQGKASSQQEEDFVEIDGVGDEAHYTSSDGMVARTGDTLIGVSGLDQEKSTEFLKKAIGNL